MRQCYVCMKKEQEAIKKDYSENNNKKLLKSKNKITTPQNTEKYNTEV